LKTHVQKFGDNLPVKALFWDGLNTSNVISLSVNLSYSKNLGVILIKGVDLPIFRNNWVVVCNGKVSSYPERTFNYLYSSI